MLASCAAVFDVMHWTQLVLYRITTAPLQEISSDKQVTDEEVKSVLAASLKSKKKNKKKKAAKVENGAKEAESEQ